MRYTERSYTQPHYKKDMAVIDAVESEMKIDLYDPDRHIEDKIDILKNILGYNGLRIGSNTSEVRFFPLEDCTHRRITAVLKERYLSALNRVAKFGDPSKRNEKNGKKDKGLVSKLDRTGQYTLF